MVGSNDSGSEKSEGTTDGDRRTFLQAVGGTAATAAGLPAAATADGDRGQNGESTRNGGGNDESLVPLTHGVASGDVTARTAVVWARAAREATITVEFSRDESFSPSRLKRTAVDETTDFTGQIDLKGLQPGSRYYYRVWATGADGKKQKNGNGGRGSGRNGDPEPSADTVCTGTFVTAPAPNDEGAVTFAWSGDTWGYGDDPVEPPYPGLKTIAELQPDFFLYLGDTIYADAATPAGKITENTPLDDALEIYRDKYKEMRDPPADVAERTHLRELLATTSVYSMWDDHEVINNFAGPIEPLMPHGLRAFQEYWPLDRDGRGWGGEDDLLYDSFQWGQNMEMFVLDTRQYRDPNVDLDGKTLLGEEQLEWLERSLADSDATWKVVASPAPFGHPSDSWATPADHTGYESELLDVVSHIREEGVSNVVVVAGDVHHSQVGAYDPDDDGEFEIYEAIAGPLGAPAGEPDDLYGPLNPTEFFGKGGYFNFGTVSVDESGETLTIGIRDEDGVEQFSKTIEAAETDPERAAPERVESTFDDGADGWLISQNGGSNRPEHRETGGNPGGHITDSEGRGGIAWYYQAPFEYLGDREPFYGGTLSFDLRQEQTDQQFDAPPTEGADVLLSNGEATIVYEFRGPELIPGEEWTSFEAPLTADANWIDLTSRDPFATEERFREVLADLEVLRIRGEYRSGDDTSYLDNVVLSRD